VLTLTNYVGASFERTQNDLITVLFEIFTWFRFSAGVCPFVLTASLPLVFTILMVVVSLRRQVKVNSHPPLLSVEDLRTYYYSGKGCVKAVDGVGLTVNREEVYGLVGESGCGKTTMALSIMRLIKPPGKIVTGEMWLDGENLIEKSEDEMDRVRWKKLSIIFQGAMNALNAVYTIGNQIAEAMIHHEGIPKREAWMRAESLLRVVGIDPSRAKDYPHELSGGMKQRAMIATVLALNPRLVIADEPVTALDVITQRKILNLINSLKQNSNLSIIIITHELSVVAEICNRVGVFYAGKIVEEVPVSLLTKEPLHPYSQDLLKAAPKIDGPREVLVSIPGDPPDLVNPPPGCRFHTRCPYAFDKCRTEEPRLIEVKERLSVACHLVQAQAK
jgi:peptide/nickel transport system ATP-binding protein